TTWSRRLAKESTGWAWVSAKSCTTVIPTRPFVGSTSGSPRQTRRATMSHDEHVTQTLTGNGLVIERTEKPGGLVPWWWIGDERHVPKALSQTYRHRDLLKAYGCRWSKKRRQWYYIGRELPEEIAAL